MMSSKHSKTSGKLTPPTKLALESVCIFCFKNDSGSKSSVKSGTGDQLIEFFEVVQHYLEGKWGSSYVSSSNRRTRGKLPAFLEVPQDLKVASCGECFQIVEAYSETYRKIKCLELELDKLLEKLEDVLRCAEGSGEDLLNGWSRREKGEMVKTLEFRRVFQKHYDLWMSELFPKAPPPEETPTTSISEQGPRKRGRPRKSSNVQAEPRKDKKLSEELRSESSLDKRLDEYREVTIKLSPPASPAQDDDCQSDWIADFDNLSQGDTKRDPDWIAQADNLSDNEDRGVEDSGHADDSSNDEVEDNSDSEWNDEEEEERPKKRTKKSPKKKQKRVSKPSSKPRAGRLECLKCRTSPRPTFGSSRLLQLHQNYLHTNGYFPLRKSDNTDVLNLTESDLKLQGISTSLKTCSECPKQFMLQEELTNHQILHSDFTCDICGITHDFAVDMTRHTISHMKENSKQEDLETGLLRCSKCPEYSTRLEGELINHHLEVHLDKPIVQAICPICQQIFKYVDQVPFIHYLNYHDLTRLDDPDSLGIRCSKKFCSAYFLTEDQLQHHLSSIHEVTSKPEVNGITPERKRELVSSRRRLKFMKYKARDCDLECEFCDRKFRAEAELKTHIWRRHAEEKAGVDCGQIKLTDNLTINEFLIEDKFVCKTCDKVLPSNDQLERHQHHHGSFNCNFCEVSKTLATELAVHETVHKIGDNEAASAGNVNCPRCPFSTRNRLDYIDHHLENHLGIPSDRKRCPICKKPVPLMLKRHGRGGAKKTWIVAHYMEYHDKTGVDKISECSDCGAYFRAPVQLYNHAREIHGKQTIRECCDCGKIFKKTELLRAHRISIHKVNESTFQFFCSVPDCEHRFERQIELDYHESNAHNERDSSGGLICPECGKKVLGSGQMAAHMKGHVTQARKMEERAKRKEERQLQRAEKKIEDEETVVVCEQCGKSFANKRLLQAHIRRHVDPSMWKFVCSVCGKKCPTRYKLTKHNWSHTGENPYVCPWCPKAFRNSQNFKIHKEKKHPEEMKMVLGC